MRRFLSIVERYPWLGIGLAAMIAHGGCLGSTFYLDDWTQIVDCPPIVQGDWWRFHLRAVTYLTYRLTYLPFGFSAPAFHAGNLLLHALTAACVAGFAREFLAARAVAMPPERARRIGGWAGLLFAVHPLCSEIPNYARARDIEMVSLFTLLAGWAVVRWRERGEWRWLAAVGAAAGGAVFSKEVGIVLAGAMIALVWLGTRARVMDGSGWTERISWWRRMGRERIGSYPVPLAITEGGWLPVIGIIGASGVVGLWIFNVTQSVWLTMAGSLRHPLLGWHVMTQARVFWMFAWRAFLPVRLCSDHMIAWTASRGDAVAWMALAALVLASGVVAWALLTGPGPRRAAGVLAALAFFAVVHRLGNVSGELMVEYRIYPAMMFVCILLAWGLDRVLARARPATAWGMLAALVAAGMVLSALRTLDWRSAETLRANVTAQYPLQARVRQEVQEADVRAKHWDAVISRQDGIRAALDGLGTYNQAHALRKYDAQLGKLTRVGSEGNVAVAMANLGQSRAALAQLGVLMDSMRQSGEREAVYWAVAYRSRGLIYDAAGKREAAMLDMQTSLELMPVLNDARKDLRRIESEPPK